MKTLSEIQREIKVWALRNFGNNKGKDDAHPSYDSPLGSICPLLGMMGELGELVQVQLRALQGRRKLTAGEEWDAKADALADLLVFACDYASREGIDLNTVLDRTWEKVRERKARSWEEDKAKESTPPDAPVKNGLDDVEVVPFRREENGHKPPPMTCVSLGGEMVCPLGKHDKVYSPVILTSHPAQRPWICRRCKTRGTDVEPAMNTDNETYDRLLKEAARAECQREGHSWVALQTAVGSGRVCPRCGEKECES